MALVTFAEKTGTRRVRFLANVFHDGIDYGPELKEQEADIDRNAAIAYVQQGRAVYIDVSEGEADDA